MTPKELMEKRAALIAEARALYDISKAEDREATAEEQEQFERLMDEGDKLKKRADDAVRLETVESELNESRGRVTEIETPEAGGVTTRTIQLRDSVCGDTRSIDIPVDIEALQEFRTYLKTGLCDFRSLSKGTDSEGGFLSPPLEFQAELIKAIDDQTFMRQISRVLPALLEASSLGTPTLAADIEDAVWTTELATGDEDSTLALGLRELKPNPAAKRIKVSKKLLLNSTMSADTIVRDRMAFKFGVTQEKAFLVGTGTGQPLGVFTVDASGVPASRNVNEDNTVTDFTADGLINAQMFLKAQYRPRAVWVMHRDAVKLARKLKSSDDQYIWQPGLQPGAPDVLLGNRVWESEFAPNTFTTGLRVAIYGDFSQYWIVDALTMTIQVLIELYAEANQTGYIGRIEADGAPVVPEAFAAVTLA